MSRGVLGKEPQKSGSSKRISMLTINPGAVQGSLAANVKGRSHWGRTSFATRNTKIAANSWVDVSLSQRPREQLSVAECNGLCAKVSCCGIIGLRGCIDFEIALIFLLKVYNREACQNWNVTIFFRSYTRCNVLLDLWKVLDSFRNQPAEYFTNAHEFFKDFRKTIERYGSSGYGYTWNSTFESSKAFWLSPSLVSTTSDVILSFSPSSRPQYHYDSAPNATNRSWVSCKYPEWQLAWGPDRVLLQHRYGRIFRFFVNTVDVTWLVRICQARDLNWSLSGKG